MGSAASRPSGPPFVVWSGTRDLAGGGSDWGVRLPVPLGRQCVLIRNLLCFALAAVSCLRRLGPGDLRFVVGGKAACSLSTRLVRLRPRSSSGLAPCPLGTSRPHICAPPTPCHLGMCRAPPLEPVRSPGAWGTLRAEAGSLALVIQLPTAPSLPSVTPGHQPLSLPPVSVPGGGMLQGEGRTLIWDGRGWRERNRSGHVRTKNGSRWRLILGRNGAV